MRKIIAIIISSLMLLSTMPVFAQNAAETAVNTDHLQIVKALGILDGFSNYEADSTAISRGEFAAVITAIMNISAYNAEQMFSDVDSGHTYFNQIGMAKSLGIMVGDENGNFGPEQPVTYAQAVKCLLYVLGYTALAEKRGGYPTGYFIQAENLDILDGISYQANARISRAVLAQMIYNCFDVAIMEVIYVGESIARSNSDEETILTLYFGMQKFEGVLNNIDGRSMLARGKEIKEGYVKIGDTVLEYTDSAISEYLGYNMEVYATDNGSGIDRLIYAFPTDDNNELMIKMSDLQTGSAAFSLTNFVYIDQSGDEEEAELTEEHRFVFNGAYDYDFDMIDLNFNTGYVKLIDNNDDTVYDVCLVWSYENYAVENVSDTLVTCHYNKSLKKDEDVTYRVLSSEGIWGGWEQLSSLVSWDILSVAESKDGSLVTVYASRGGVSGTVESVSNDGETIAEIGGNEYVVSAQYTGLPANSDYIPIKPGLTSEFYFDIIGEIAAVYKIGSADGAYGYMLGIQKLGGLSDVYIVKIYTENGKTEIYTVEDKIRFTSSTYNDAYCTPKEISDSFAPGGSFEPQMVKYSADDYGFLTEIHQFTDATEFGYNLDKFSRDFNMGDASGATNAEKFRFMSVAMTFGTGSLYEKQFHITDATKIFYIPKEDGKINADKMRIVDTSMFKQGYYDNIQVFDCDDTYSASAIIYSPDQKSGSDDSNNKLDDYFLAVTKVYVGLDEYGEPQNMIRAMYCGIEKEFPYLLAKGESAHPEEGSVILYEKDLDDNVVIRSSNVVYSPSREITLYNKLKHSDENSDQMPTVWSQVGRLWRKNGSNLSLYVGDERPWASYLSSNASYYKISNGKIEAADDSILVPSSVDSINDADGSLMLMNYRYHYVREVYVIVD